MRFPYTDGRPGDHGEDSIGERTRPDRNTIHPAPHAMTIHPATPQASPQATRPAASYGPARITRGQEDLPCCRIAVSRDGMMAALHFHHDRRNPARVSLHPIMADGRTLGAIGQNAYGDVPDHWNWDDVTDYVIR